LLTLRGIPGPRRGAGLNDIQVISDGSLLISKGVIQEVGPTRRIENLAAARKAIEISAIGKVVMPGFVDSHTHLIFPPAGVEDHDRAVRMICSATARRLRHQQRGVLANMARHGTTTVEVKTGCGLVESAEMKMLRVLGSLNGDPQDVIPTYLLRFTQRDSSYSLEYTLREILPKIRRRRLARFADVLWDPQWPHPDGYATYLSAARASGFSLKVHAAAEYCSEAVSLGVAQDAQSVDCLEGVGIASARKLAASQTVATLTAGAALAPAGCSAARTLVDAGAAIALATGFNANRPGTLNMQTVVALGHMRMGLSLNEAITAATINGAHALGCADRIGSFEPGKLADVLMLDSSDYRELGRHIGANLVHMAIKRGRVIYREADVGDPHGTSQGIPARL
jgi:imidazolonepropionase